MKLRLIALLIIISLALSLAGCVVPFVPDIDFPSSETPEPTPDTPDNPDGTDGGEGGAPSGDPQPSGPVTPTKDGYTFETFVTDEVYPVANVREAASIIDEAIASHLARVVLDLTAFGEDFDPAVDFEIEREFTSHTWLRYTYDTNEPHILTVHINYKANSASIESPLTEENTYTSIASANDILSRASVPEDRRRGASFSDFPIDTGERKTRDVYNSEELWWAIEHGYRPTFPMEDSVAEEIYERAREVLREIIYVGMSDFEKALAIYEYIVSAVCYDYDAASDLENVATSANACYYLEGVFLNGRAVCDGKSKAFVLLCGIEGIETVRDFGFSPAEEVGHAWNYVKIDDLWYFVDTTNGDAAKSNPSSPIAEFYGKNVELINYKTFLAPLSSLDGMYVASGVWQEITDTDRGQSRVSEVLAGRLCDAYVESSEELAAMISAVIELGVTEFSLTISVSSLVSFIYGSNTPHTLANNATELLGLTGRLERLAFIENIDRNKNYMYVFKLLPEAESIE